MYAPPSTREEWWSNVDTYWTFLLPLLLMDNSRFGNMVVRSPYERGEQCVLPYPYDGPQEPDDVVVQAQVARASRDHTRLLSILSAAWSAAPDHRSIHRRMGWNVLCDLLSEAYAVEESCCPPCV